MRQSWLSRQGGSLGGGGDGAGGGDAWLWDGLPGAGAGALLPDAVAVFAGGLDVVLGMTAPLVGAGAGAPAAAGGLGLETVVEVAVGLTVDAAGFAGGGRFAGITAPGGGGAPPGAPGSID